jgi:hypothetical protein
VGFFSTIVAVALSATILIFGMRFAPKLPQHLENGILAAGDPA